MGRASARPTRTRTVTGGRNGRDSRGASVRDRGRTRPSAGATAAAHKVTPVPAGGASGDAAARRPWVRRFFADPLFWIGLGALAVRLVYFAELWTSPLFSVPVGDGWQYDAWARGIAEGQWLGTGVFYQSPLYPYLLGALYSLAGHSLIAVRLMQAAMGAVSCVLLGRAGRRFLGDKVGTIAAALLAVYPWAVFSDGLIQKSSLDVLLLTAILALLAEVLSRPHWWNVACAGLAAGALTLNRENAGVLCPVIATWLLVYAPGARPLKTRLARAALFAAAFGAVLLPVGLRNYAVGREFVLSTSQGGSNFYIGNHPGASGTYEPLVPGHGSAEYEGDDARKLAERSVGRPLAAREVSAYWFDTSIAYIRAQPGDWLRLMGRKLLLTLNAAEIADSESIEAYSRHSMLLRGLRWFGFGLVLPLSALGFWITRHDWRRLALLYGMAAGLALSVAVFFVLARYRYPMVPILLLFAAAGLAGVARLETSSLRRLGPGVALALAVAVVSRVPLAPPPRPADTTLFNVGLGLLKSGRTAEAVPLLQRAVEAAPDDPAAHHALGVALTRVGDMSRAVEEFRASVRLGPTDFEAQSSLGLALKDAGHGAEALGPFAEAVRLNPESAAARTNLGLALSEAGRSEEAVTHLRESVRLQGNDPLAHNILAFALQRQGDVRGATEHYQRALTLSPDYAEAHNNLALLLRETGDIEGAIDHFEEAARRQPENVGIRMNLAGTLAGAGRTREAMEHCRAAARLAPEAIEVHYLMGQVSAQEGRLDEAVLSFERALQIAQSTGRADQAAQIEAAIAMCRNALARRGR